MQSTARTAYDRPAAAPAAAQAAVPVHTSIPARHNAPLMQRGTIPLHSHTAVHHDTPNMPWSSSNGMAALIATCSAAGDSSSSSNSGNRNSEGNRSSGSLSSRGGASSSSNKSGSTSLFINIADPINAALGIKTLRTDDATSAQAPAREDHSSVPQWLLLPLRSYGDGSSASSSDGSATATKPCSKGRYGVLLPSWWMRSKGRTLGIVSGMATVVALAALMVQMGIIGSQHSSLELPVLTATLDQSAAAPGTPAAPSVEQSRAMDALAALLLMYDPGQGLFQSMGWWNQANSLEAIIDYALLVNSTDFNALLANTFDKTGELKYLCNYFDDEGWWGITWAKAYTLTGRQAYRDVAVGIYMDMRDNGWQDSCGGGMLWRKGQPFRATISSGLYMMLAMLLHETATSQDEKDDYIQAAGRTWRWLNKVGMIQSSGRLGDGMEGDCSLRKTPLFSYNQGVLMGALLRMTAVTGDGRYLSTAYKAADAGIRAITNSAGIITEDCDPEQQNVDGCQFKGVFVRYLYDLYLVKKTANYRKLLLDNADSAWDSRQNGTNRIGVSWRGSFVDKANAEGILQTAGLDLLNGALGIKLYG